MKRRSSRTALIQHTSDLNVLIPQINQMMGAISTDLSDLCDNGVTFSDNMNADIKLLEFTSGVPQSIGKPKNSFQASGVSIINTFGATVRSVTSKTQEDGNILVTVEMTPTTNNLKVIVYGG